jgi:succinate-semialdehyde dehydrogenase/glutarate-semialdehyde dehydrogenase
MAFTTVNPTTGKVEATFDQHTPAEVEALVERAARTFSTYRHTSFAERAGWMRAAADLYDAEQPDIARVLTTEMGKTFSAAKAEVAKCALCMRWYADHAEGYLADEVVESGAGRSFIRFEPLGPVLAVMPWNFPLWQVIRFAAPALMAGNVGLLKHASNVPQSALLLEDVFRRAGFPAGAFATLLVPSGDVAGLIADDRIVAVTLTGSEAAGRSVGEAAGKALKKCVLELGPVRGPRLGRRRAGGPDGGDGPGAEQRPVLHRGQAIRGRRCRRGPVHPEVHRRDGGPPGG